MMRPRPVDSTDEGVVYERPDGTRYIQPYRPEPKRGAAQTERLGPRLPPKQPVARASDQPAWLHGHGPRPTVKLRLLRLLAARRADQVDQLADLVNRESSGIYRHCYDLMRYGLIQRKPDKARNPQGQRVFCYSITAAGGALLKRWGVRGDV